MKSTHNCSRRTASSVSPDLLCLLLGGQAVRCQSRGCLWAYSFARYHPTHPSIPAVHLLSYYFFNYYNEKKLHAKEEQTRPQMKT